MKTLILKDLHIESELDAASMAAVSGGTGFASCIPVGCLPSYAGPSFDFDMKSLDFKASQQLQQSQGTLVNNGNNVAFASGITANVTPTQNGSNNINFH
ncbi:hypothetical protein SAMN06265795_103142 [Noviherbaspirillum humi]|uniref:Uncharacterized protein n=1 Tax=Noviherbaspirillum humi TaxID=1688639 RepID=A0A239F3H7_9BURK|nr:hypothetical protein [Noviherbaspirillum humi]SNS51068.1 hypothetical protein SAMN06265795_103142 [Noviherbaspirillum humi]